MKIYPINSIHSISSQKIRRTNNNFGINNTHNSNYYVISFKGNPSKKPEHIAAYGTESNFLGGIYKAGGLGDVAEALPEAIAEHGKDVTGKNIDMRSFYPYYSFDDEKGRIYVSKKGTKEKLAKNIKLQRNEDFFLAPQDYRLKEGENFVIITEAKEGKQVTKFFFLEETGIQGTVNRVARDGLDMEKVPYRIFEVNTNGARKDGIYLIHTPEVAGGKAAYGINSKYNVVKAVEGTSSNNASSAYGGKKPVKKVTTKIFENHAANDMFYTEQTRAMKRALESMNTQKFKNFSPQSILLHDRFPAVILTDAMQYAKEGNDFWYGIKYVDLLHNPGRGYQGCFDNPLDFFRIVATDTDVKALKASPNYSKIKEISEKITKGTATKEECDKLYRFFKPYFNDFVDAEGSFNMTKIALFATENNPNLVSPGHVSKYFGKEAADFATEDIAKGLTGDFQRLDEYILSVTNGAKPANMATSAQDGFFGTGTLNSIFKNTKEARRYTPFSKGDGADKIFKAKTANKMNLINIISEATERLSTDSDAIAKVFFDDNKIKGIRGKETDLKLTLGGLSKYSPEDLLFISWGRPDPQKGLQTTARAFRMFLEDESIPIETRKRCKLLFGAGGGNDAWRPINGIEPSEWKGIQNEMKKIAEIEAGGVKGAFKENALYVNGLFPNRLANCADLAVLTSRYEPCGITPFESFATGTPVVSIKTGGAPDFITEGKTGLLTEDAFMLSKEKLGLPKDITAKALDDARVEHSANQVKDKIKEFLKPIEDGSFEAKQKKYIENCMNEKIEWHNNNSYNKGKSALEIYLKDKCHTKDNNVNGAFRSSGRGKFDESVFNNVREGKKHTNLKSKKALLAVGIGALAVGSAYAIYNYNKNTKKESKHLSTII